MYKFTVVFYDEEGNIVAEEDRSAKSVEEVEELAQDNVDEYCADSYIVA